MLDETAVFEVTSMNQGVFDAFLSLTPQLSSSSPIPSYSELEQIVNSDATKLFIATHEASGDIMGSLTLVLFRIPTGLRAWIEDVVVDDQYRRRGIGKLLCEKAVEVAKAEGTRTIDLTSRPARAAANELYKSTGFKIRKTNVYRIEIR